MNFFNIANHDQKAGTAVIQIMDQIGYNWWTDKGVEATNFINDVRGLGELNEVFLEINSPGGNVYDGVSIANFIKAHGAKWTACVIGQAASIATVIASACDEIEMGVGTNYLVHKPMSALQGYVNADECRALAKDLDTIENSIIDFYLPRIEASGKTKDELIALMEEDRYMSSDEAMEWGFVDSKAVDITAVAFTAAKVATEIAALKSVIAHKDALLAKAGEQEAETISINFNGTFDAGNETLIENLRKHIEGSDFELVELNTADAKHIASVCAEADLACLMPSFVEAGLSNEQVDSKVAQAKEIQTLCAASNLDSQVILKNMDNTTEMLRYAISEALALNDPELDGSLPSGVDDPKSAAINTAAIYEKRNNKGK